MKRCKKKEANTYIFLIIWVIINTKIINISSKALITSKETTIFL
jgi:hypothetical protein